MDRFKTNSIIRAENPVGEALKEGREMRGR